MADNLIEDIQADFLGGQDASHTPDRIAENAYAAGVNISVKKGIVHSRWGFSRITLEYPTDTLLDPYRRVRTYRELFDGGKFQLAAPFFIGPTQYIVLVISGIIYLFNPDTHVILVVSISDGSRLNSRVSRLNWAACGATLVIFDFPAFPVILEGLNARRADPAKQEVPVSTIGAFNENRLFIGNAGDEYTAGDPVGSAAFPDAPVSFTELLTVGSPYFGQAFRLPTNDHNDPISYMGFLQSVDTSTGIGPLLIATGRTIYSVHSEQERVNWTKQQFASNFIHNAGIAGPRALANANSDAFYMSPDGYVRTLSMSRDEQSKWSRTPMSRPVENWFKVREPTLTQFGFVTYFKNKVFFSVNPYRTQALDFTTFGAISDYAHGGLVVMELDNFVNSLGQTQNPTWAGLWTGVRPMEMVNVGDRAFIISKDDAHVNRIYEVNPNLTYDTSDDKVRFIRSRIYTRQYSFKNPFLNKELHSMDLNLANIQGDFKLKLDYKPSHGCTFTNWKTFCHDAPWRSCNMPQDSILNGFCGHTFRDLTFGAPEEEGCNAVTDEEFKLFRKIQLRFTISGAYWELYEYLLRGVLKPKLPNQTDNICVSTGCTTLSSECTDDWLIEPFESCNVLTT